MQAIQSPVPRTADPADGSDWEIEVFFDGDCPLCQREIAFLQRLDRRHRIRFTNIAAADFDPDAIGVTFDGLMAEIHGRLPDGTVLRGVEVFRRLYGAVGWRRLMALTRRPGLRQMLDIGYRLFARNRLRLTGRCTTACQIERPPSAAPQPPDAAALPQLVSVDEIRIYAERAIAEPTICARTLHVLQAIPREIVTDLLRDPCFQIALDNFVPGQGGTVWMACPGDVPWKGSRSVVLKTRLAGGNDGFAQYVIAHELAHAHLWNGPWGDITDPEEAADALAASWGFHRPASWQ